MYQIVLILKGPDGDWLAFAPVTDEPNEVMGSLCLWGQPVYRNISDPDADELTAGMTISVPAEDYNVLPLELLGDLKPYEAGL